MTNNPDEIRREIEDTRGRLSNDVNALTETVSPSNVAKRQADKVAGVASSVKDHVMGTADDLRSTGSDAASSIGHAPGAAASKAKTKTQGNPLAAGLIAFGVGWLVSSLLPASQKEQELAQQAETMLRENKDTLLAPAKEMAQEMGEQLKPAAQDAVESVKSTAQDAAQTVKDEGQSAVEDVKGQAQDSKETVQSHSSGL